MNGEDAIPSTWKVREPVKEGRGVFSKVSRVSFWERRSWVGSWGWLGGRVGKVIVRVRRQGGGGSGGGGVVVALARGSEEIRKTRRTRRGRKM